MSVDLNTFLLGIVIILVMFILYSSYTGDSPMKCGCRRVCKCNKKQMQQMQQMHKKQMCNMPSNMPSNMPDAEQHNIQENYQEITKNMGLEKSVSESHNNWCRSLDKNGLSTGASACTTLEETGRSYGTSDYVGLTSRKWCKARMLATPAEDSRVIPSSDIYKENCNIDMNELV